MGKVPAILIKDSRRIIGLLMILFAVILNQWTVNAVLRYFIGSGLGVCANIVLWSVNIALLMIAIDFWLRGRRVKRELRLLGLFFVPMTAALIYTAFISKSIDMFVEMIVGQMLAMLPLLIVAIIFKRRGYYFAFIIFGLYVIMPFGYRYIYGDPISDSVFFIMFETNASETAGFFKSYFRWMFIFYIAVHTFFFFLMHKKTRRINWSIMRVYLLGIFMALSAQIITRQQRTTLAEHNWMAVMFSSLRQFNDTHQEYKALAAKPLSEIEPVNCELPRPSEELHVLVIGESANRHHMGIYGYQYPTTPRLEEIASELFVFDDVVSPHAHTIAVMKKILTFASVDISLEDTYDKGTMIHYLRKAGYKTYWLSNQNPIGIYETTTTVLAETCDEHKYINHGDSEKEICDLELLDHFKDILDEDIKRKFVFVHLIGNHSPFELRYPQEFNVFHNKQNGLDDQANENMNHYDNAVLHNDTVIRSLIEMVRDTNRFATLTYLSDHGEDVYDTQPDFFGHSEDIATTYMFEIPYILWVSDSFRAHGKELIDRLSNSVHRRFMSDDLPYTIFDLLGLYFETNQPQLSLYSKDYKEKSRIVGKADKLRDYDTQLRKDELRHVVRREMFHAQNQLFKDSVWLDRVNTIDKLREVKDITVNIEVDVEYLEDRDVFDIRHPEEDSIGLTLEFYLANIISIPDCKLWLDFGNLTPEDANAALARLTELTDKYMLNRRNIIIGCDDADVLSQFRQGGFYICYYLPELLLKRINSKPIEDRDEMEEQLKMEIRAKYFQVRPDAVGLDCELLDLALEIIPEADGFMVWQEDLEYYDHTGLGQINDILGKDGKVSGVLTRYDSRFDRKLKDEQ
ncbi:MAG: sulfatase-like hydrolase/transferase [Phycisphaerae bacterium]|nr:sulfatase-like hydrolase/transferase [Phycisphaerae bacterium]